MNNTVRRHAPYQVPRYMSYPTAADFTPGVAAKEHSAWLGKLQPGGYPLHRVRALTFQ